MRDELQLGRIFPALRVSAANSKGLAQLPCRRASLFPCLRAPLLPCLPASLPPSDRSKTSEKSIATVPRLEITVTYSYKRRKHFLIETRTAFPVTRPESFPEHESRSTGHWSLASPGTPLPPQPPLPPRPPFLLAAGSRIAHLHPHRHSKRISLGACRPVVLISQSAPAFGAFPSEFHALGNDSPRWQSRRKDFREGFSI
jgi:hypothetical protein